jgi:hypothetical protein
MKATSCGVVWYKEESVGQFLPDYKSSIQISHI